MNFKFSVFWGCIINIWLEYRYYSMPASWRSKIWNDHPRFSPTCIAGVVRDQIWLQIWIQPMKNPPVQFFGAIGATCGVWQHIAIFTWWHAVNVILRGSTYNNIYYRRNFCYQNKEINRRISIKYGRDNIALKLFQNNVQENKFKLFIYTEKKKCV